MPDNIPETGDVVIHSSGSHAPPSFAIRAVPGPDQFGCATRAEAERMARSCAKCSGVNLWFSESLTDFTLLGLSEEPHVNSPGESLNRWCDPCAEPTIARDIS
jgi:hypothetical protein